MNDANNAGTLAPCPFCGCSRIDVYTDDGDDLAANKHVYVAQCYDCGARTSPVIGKANAMGGWNTRALSTPDSTAEQREAIATIIHDSDCAKHNMPAYPNGPCDCGAEVAAKLRYLSSPDAERMSDFERLNSFCHEGHNAADLLAARLDEAAIRKDERKKCAKVADDYETTSHFGIVAKRAIAGKIRNGGKQP